MPRPYHADADGVITDAHYEQRVSGWDVRRWREFQPFVDKMKALIGGKGRVLDLGAGEGFLTRCCIENGLDAVGLEGSPVAVRWGRESLGIDIRAHNLKDPLLFTGAMFDLVMYHDVYEHVPDRVNRVVFPEAFRVLKCDGFFWVITTCRYDLVECAELEHINNPTPTELLRYGTAHGFEGRILRPAFNISLFTPWFYDRNFNVKGWKRRLRHALETRHRMISLIFAPLWLPVWYLNARLLHIPLLDFVGRTSNVLFKKPGLGDSKE